MSDLRATPPPGGDRLQFRKALQCAHSMIVSE